MGPHSPFLPDAPSVRPPAEPRGPGRASRPSAPGHQGVSGPGDTHREPQQLCPTPPRRLWSPPARSPGCHPSLPAGAAQAQSPGRAEPLTHRKPVAQALSDLRPEEVSTEASAPRPPLLPRPSGAPCRCGLHRRRPWWEIRGRREGYWGAHPSPHIGCVPAAFPRAKCLPGVPPKHL